MSRNRTTWAADRKASAPPATPGYGTEDQDHPAHQPDPAYEAYKDGDPDAWAETPKTPPYPEGNPPAVPGYDVEDQDHPAHTPAMPRVPKEASLRVQVERKASKCIRVARVMLGCDATPQMVEDQALDLMDVADENLDAMYARMSGGFLAQDEPEEVQDEEIAKLLAQDDEPAEDGVMARIKAMEEELEALKKGTRRAEDQNAPNEGGETEEQVKAEAAATTKGEEPGGGAAKTAFRKLLASMADKDGFVTAADWKGKKSIFAFMDTDKDGIVAVDEGVKAFFEDEVMVEDDMGLSPEDTALLAELESQVACKAAGEVPPEFLEQQKKKEDEGEKKDEDEKKGAKKAEEEAPEDKPEDEPEEKPEEEDSKEEKEAATFAMTSDPMGLGDSIPDDDALLAEVFGGKVAKKADDDEDDEKPEGDDEIILEEAEEEGEEKEGGKKKASVQNPQRPKTASGPKTLGSQTRTASAARDELSSLWDCAPDVSAVFGVPKSSNN